MGRIPEWIPEYNSIFQVTAPLFSSRLFEFGADSGDHEMPNSLDVGKKVTLRNPMKYYGQEHSDVYVGGSLFVRERERERDRQTERQRERENERERERERRRRRREREIEREIMSNIFQILSNGAIGFNAASRSYKTGIFPEGDKLIAPFWNRNDLRNGGHVWYREVTSELISLSFSLWLSLSLSLVEDDSFAGGRVLERGQSEIRYQYDVQVRVKSALLVTWEQMQPLGAAALPEDVSQSLSLSLIISLSLCLSPSPSLSLISLLSLNLIY